MEEDNEAIKFPDNNILVSKLMQNSLLTEIERKYIVAVIENNHLELVNNFKRKCEMEPCSTANKKTQFCSDVFNLKTASTQTDDSYVQPAPKINRSKSHGDQDLNYKSKRLAIEEKWDRAKVSEVMNISYRDRRRFILEQSPVVPLVKDMYPLLFCVSEVRNELNRIFYDGKDQEFLSNIEKHADAILDIVDHKNVFYKVIREKIAAALTPVQKQYAKEVGALLILSNLLKEKRQYLSTEDEPCPKSNYPRIEATCKVERLFYDQHMFRIMVENVFLCEASDFKEAVLCLMAAFYIFNISYPETALKTFFIMERVFLEANDTDGNEINDQTHQIVTLIQMKRGVRLKI